MCTHQLLGWLACFHAEVLLNQPGYSYDGMKASGVGGRLQKA